jgi:hypothetical protein
MGNYINKLPNGTMLGPEKSGDLAAFCDEELAELPQFEHIPAGLVLVCIVDTGPWEAALVADTKKTWDRVNNSKAHGDKRPVRFFLIKREWVRQMADKALDSDKEAT